ncbi:serine-rich adhesin for platelets-like [Saccostrea cucullata]|uniref:serine-rich adhesin for platelets-like n=1 Tax=Saccostrea cuccullata TaxID=36930 RepID=UPI002ED56401
MKLGTEKLNVEILQISDSKRQLNTFEDDWSTSHRSIALDREKKKRRNQPDGYLSVWPQDMEDVVGEEVQPAPVEQTNDNDQPNEAAPTRKTKGKAKEKTGSKGRKITVLHEGSGDFSSDTTSPKRAPCFLEEVNGDERDLINLQIRQHQEGLRNVSVQTEKVVVLGTEDVLPPLMAETFSAMTKTLGQIQKEQQATKALIQDLMGEIKTLKENQLSRPSLGGLLSTSDLPELTVNTSMDKLVETVQELEESLSTKPPQRTSEPETENDDKEEPLPKLVKRPRQNKTASATHSIPLATSSARKQNTTSPVDTSAKTSHSFPSTTTSASSATTVSTHSSTSTTSSPSAVTNTTMSPYSSTSTTSSPSAITNTTMSPHSSTSTTSSPSAITNTTMSPHSSTSTTSSQSAITNTTMSPHSSTSTTSSPSAITNTATMSTRSSTSTTTSSPSAINNTTVSTRTSLSTTSSSPSANTDTATVSSPQDPTSTASSPSLAIRASPPTKSVMSTFSSPPSINSTSYSTNAQNTSSATTSISNTPPASSLTTINMSQAAAILPASMIESSPSPSTNKKTIRFNCFPGPIIEIDGPQDVCGTPEDAEFRIRQKTLMSTSSAACSKPNFGWILVQKIYSKEELIGRNFFGNRKNIPAISPRRRHAIEHAVAEMYGSNEAHLKEVISGINTGLRKMRSRRLPFTSLENI